MNIPNQFASARFAGTTRFAGRPELEAAFKQLDGPTLKLGLAAYDKSDAFTLSEESRKFIQEQLSIGQSTGNEASDLKAATQQAAQQFLSEPAALQAEFAEKAISMIQVAFNQDIVDDTLGQVVLQLIDVANAHNLESAVRLAVRSGSDLGITKDKAKQAINARLQKLSAPAYTPNQGLPKDALNSNDNLRNWLQKNQASYSDSLNRETLMQGLAQLNS